MRREGRPAVAPAFLALATLVAFPGCKPTAFASHEANLLREPPPLLPTDVNAYWNDAVGGTYGELTVGPGAYQYGGVPCRTARVTSITTATGQHQDQTLLYCPGQDGQFHLDRSLTCRAAAGVAIACRTPDGDDVTLQPG